LRLRATNAAAGARRKGKASVTPAQSGACVHKSQARFASALNVQLGCCGQLIESTHGRASFNFLFICTHIAHYIFGDLLGGIWGDVELAPRLMELASMRQPFSNATLSKNH